MKTEKLLKVMFILAWIVFIGLLIKAGSIITSYSISISNEYVAKDLFRGLDLFEFRMHSFWNYTFIIGYKVLVYCLQAFITYLIIKLLSKINVEKPFSVTVLKLLQKISYTIIYIWIIAMTHNTHITILEKKHSLVAEFFTSEFIFLAAIIFIISQLYKRGIEIQSENNLTI